MIVTCLVGIANAIFCAGNIGSLIKDPTSSAWWEYGVVGMSAWASVFCLIQAGKMFQND